MFQYATGRYLAEKHRTTLKLDLSHFEIQNPQIETQAIRHYNLHAFNIWENIATQQEIDSFSRNSTSTEKLFFRISRRLGFNFLSSSFLNQGITYKERHFHFDENFLNLNNNTYLAGTWQSEKYLVSVSNILRREFTLKYLLPEPVKKYVEEIDNSYSVSLHIRRGDYADNPTANNFHGTLNLDYYSQSIKYILDSFKNPHFFIFSDDLEWVIKHLKIDSKSSLVSDNKGQLEDYEELYLMSRCKHHIIGNSTFSWWGAWLNRDPEKIVISPKNWFKSTKYQSKDIIPESWIKL